MDPQVTTTIKGNHTAAFLGVLVFVIIAGSVGYFVGFNTKGSAPAVTATVPEQQENIVEVSPLFESQRATINGEVLGFTTDTVTIKSANGKTEEFPLYSKVLIYTPIAGKPASSSSEIKAIQINKFAFIVLDFIEGKYQVAHISYPPLN